MKQAQDMNFSLIISKSLFVICLLSFTALVCLSATSSKQPSNDKVRNNPGRYTRGYGYHGHQNQARQKERKSRKTQELSLPPFQVISNILF